jgi:transposase
MTKRYTYFIGIDVSRNKLDYAVLQGSKLLFHKQTINDATEIAPFITELKALPKFAICKAVFCMEQTGIYCNKLLEYLNKLKANIVVENPLVIKNSLGLPRNKYDKIDSIRIAQYACKNKDTIRLLVRKRTVILELANLFTIRNRLLTTQVAMKMPINEQAFFSKKTIYERTAALCKQTIKGIKQDLLATESAINHLMDKDNRIKRLMQIITSVPGVGRITAIQLIISTNEFLDINDPKKFACYAGVAPFIRESGNFKGKAKVSNIANKKVKSALHICAMVNMRMKGELKAYYQRKTEVEGKPKMAVLNAIRNKILLRVFACVNQDRLFEVDYTPI